ncbi:MAG: hypothetical protein WCA81_17160 [Rhizomicrobium sp.]
MQLVEPSLKERLWHKARADLVTYAPQIVGNGTLMCCACGRFLPQDKFDIEHIIPQQALLDDPPEIKSNPIATKAIRSGTILLCKEPLRVRGATIYRNGCNSWKGRFFDTPIREALNGRIQKRFTDQHLIALLCMAYLAMFGQFGYRAVLIQSGLLMRQQFFSPKRFHKEMPRLSKLVLRGQPPDDVLQHLGFWLTPFNFSVEGGSCHVTCRNVAIPAPISRDPRLPLARHLQIIPNEYGLRPNFQTSFH